jgi:hypothetical protein
VTDQNEPTPAAAAVRAFRLRMAGAAGVALLLTFVLLVWASPGPPADDSDGAVHHADPRTTARAGRRACRGPPAPGRGADGADRGT